MSGDFMFDEIIMNLFINSTEKQGRSVNIIFFKIKDDKIYLCQGYLHDCSWKKNYIHQNNVTYTSLH